MCEVRFSGDGEVVGNFLAGGDVGERPGRVAGDADDVGEVGGFVELAENQGGDTGRGEAVDGIDQAALSCNQTEDEVDFVNFAVAEKFLELLDAIGIAGTAAGGVDEDEIEIPELVERLAEFVGIGGNLHREVNDLSVGAKLFDGCDAEGVDGDKAGVKPFAEMIVGGELGDGGRLADSGWSDESDDPTLARLNLNRSGAFEIGLNVSLQARIDEIAIAGREIV